VFFVIPKITRIFEDSEAALPFVTVVLLFVVNTLRGYWPFMLIATALIIFGVRYYKRTPAGKRVYDTILLRLPYFGKLLKTFYAATFARTLSSLLESGVPILKALNMTSKVLNNSLFDDLIRKSIREITEGGSLSMSFKGTTLFPSLFVHMVSIGEKSGELDGLLLKAADTYEGDFERSITRALAIIEPVLIITMGIVVGFIVLAILLPIFQLNDLVV
ncbi:MAG: type II secretion system F family protein, partial [Thermodesulfobacteriota bacterium]